MPATVELPGLGKVRRDYVVAGGIALGGAVGWAYIRRYRELAAAADQTVYGEGLTEEGLLEGTLPYQVAQGSYSGLVDQSDTRTGFKDNAAWGEAARNYLVDSGVDPEAAAVAIGRYLDRQPLDATQQNWVRAALGGVGPPPMGTYQIIAQQGPPAAVALPAPTGIKGVGGIGSITWTWSPVTGATGYDVELVAGENTRIRGPQVVTGHQWVTSGLDQRPNIPYRLNIWARGSSGARGARGTAVGKTSAAPVLPAPQALRIAANPVAVTADWRAVPGAKGYIVEVIAGENTRVASRIVNVPKVENLGGLRRNSLYRLKVTAVNVANQPSRNSANKNFRTKP
jgi:hypothetical protein